MKTYLAIVCITIILITCIIKDLDGTLAMSGIALLAGLGGYAAGAIKKGGKK